VITEQWAEQKKKLVAYMKTVSVKYHRTYALKYFFCEILACLMVLLNMALMHNIFNNFWTTYQPAMLALLKADATSFSQFAAIIFPLQAKCDFHTFGSSGSVELRDGLCFLPYNVILEKVFAFFYIWYILMLTLSLVTLFNTSLMMMFNSNRILSIGKMFDRKASRRDCKAISGNGDFGYWFTLRTFHYNLSPVLFQDLLNDLKASAAKLPRVNEGKYSHAKSRCHEEEEI
jgi:innexin